MSGSSCFVVRKEVNLEVNALKRLIMPPSVGEGDLFTSVIGFFFAVWKLGRGEKSDWMRKKQITGLV